jgi:hypothetical protein
MIEDPRTIATCLDVVFVKKSFCFGKVTSSMDRRSPTPHR